MPELTAPLWSSGSFEEDMDFFTYFAGYTSCESNIYLFVVS